MECHRCGKDKAYHGKGKKIDPEKGGHRFDDTPHVGTIRWVNWMMRNSWESGFPNREFAHVCFQEIIFLK